MNLENDKTQAEDITRTIEDIIRMLEDIIGIEKSEEHTEEITALKTFRGCKVLEELPARGGRGRQLHS